MNFILAAGGTGGHMVPAHALAAELRSRGHGVMLITADHGNLEEMLDRSSGQAHTQHTTNPVPLLLVGPRTDSYGLKDGRLCDIAPTLLHFLGLEQPAEMTGDILAVQNSGVGQKTARRLA